MKLFCHLLIGSYVVLLSTYPYNWEKMIKIKKFFKKSIGKHYYESLNAFFQRSGTRQWCSHSSLISSSAGTPASAVRQERHSDSKEREKTVLIFRWREFSMKQILRNFEKNSAYGFVYLVQEEWGHYPPERWELCFFSLSCYLFAITEDI